MAWRSVNPTALIPTLGQRGWPERTLPTQRPSVPRKLAALAKKLGPTTGSRTSGTDTPAAGWPPRPLELIVADVEACRPVPVLELWRLLDDGPAWESWSTSQGQRLGATRGGDIAEALWRLAETDAPTRVDLLWRAIGASGGLGFQCPAILCHPSAGFMKVPDGAVLYWTVMGQASRLTHASRQAGQSPGQWLRRRGLPASIDLVAKALRSSVAAFSQGESAQQTRDQTWLVICLDDALPSARDEAIERLLAQLSQDQLGALEALRTAILGWYPTEGRRFAALSPDTQRRVQALAGFAGWDAFIQFTETITGHKLADLDWMQGNKDLDQPARIRRNALGRVAIWSNYSAQFRALQLFVPDRVRGKLQTAGNTPVNVFPAEGEHGAYAIFEIGEFTVVQFLTNRKPTLFLRERLIRGNIAVRLSQTATLRPVASIDCGGKKWQTGLYESITGLGLRPNEGLTRFRGVLGHFLDRKTGLPRRTS